MLFPCNLTPRGRWTRLAISVALLLPAGIGAWGAGALTAGAVLTLGLGAFVLFEAVKGWCVLVATLERLRRGLTRHRTLRLLLGST